MYLTPLDEVIDDAGGEVLFKSESSLRFLQCKDIFCLKKSVRKKTATASKEAQA